MSLEEHMRIVPSEVDILRSELEEVKQKMEALQTQHIDELYKASLEVDKRDGAIRQLKKLNVDLSEKNALYQKDTIQLQEKVQKAGRSQFLAVEKEMMNNMRLVEEELERGKRAIEKEVESYKLAIESERRSFRDTINREKERAKQEIDKGKQAIIDERENIAVWKRKSMGSRNRLLEMQSMYNDTVQSLNQSHDQNAELEESLVELEQSFQTYRQRNGFVELQEREYEIGMSRARIESLEATVMSTGRESGYSKKLQPVETTIGEEDFVMLLRWFKIETTITRP